MTRLADLGPGRFPRGIHPTAHKELADEAAITVLPHPATVRVPVLQHIGAPSSICAEPRSTVALGDPIATATGPVSAAAHASIAGKVGKPTQVTLANGRHLAAVPITAGKVEQIDPAALYQAVIGGDWSLGESLPPGDAIRQAIAAAGIVGMGGAGFPTHIKLAPSPDHPIDTLLVNACECEPYLTADERVLLEAPAGVLAGARLAARACGAERVVIATESTKTRVIAAIRAVDDRPEVSLAVLAAQYPMGGEKQTIRAALGRIVPTGGLPRDVGVAVVNAGTCLAIAGAVLRERPMTHRVVTVSGAGIVRPANLLVPVGCSCAEVIDHCGGLSDDAARVISGGPMMGFALGSLDTPITKGSSGITVLTQADVAAAAATTCIRCARCVDVCPLALLPTRLGLASRHSNWELAKRHHIQACMECGCCAAVCPARIPLVQLIRSGKARLAAEAKR